jgi:hypothetical protein
MDVRYQLVQVEIIPSQEQVILPLLLHINILVITIA